jgi:putative nucleotidyltransferase with HDIG domain
MEALVTLATDCGAWRDAIDPRVEARLTGAIDALAEFPVLDGTVLRILGLCDDPEATTAEIVAAIEHDASFAVNLLHYANSAALARPVRAKSVRQAVMLVGRRTLRRLSLEAATYRFLERAPGAGGAVRGQMHVHAIAVAVTAAAAADAGRVHGEAAHVAGLLHDIGKLVLPLAFGEDVVEDIARQHPAGPSRAHLERARLGIDHAMAGALLAQRWGLPAEVTEAIAMHHGGTNGLTVPSREAACVQIAGAVADLLVGAEIDADLLDLAMERIGVSREVLDSLAVHAGAPLRAMATTGLDERVDRVAEAARVDDLTGLATRRRWLTLVHHHLTQIGLGSVILLAVDGLANVTRSQGYNAANLVLTEVARIASRHGEAGRVGGTLLGVWVDSGRAEAQRVAQAIRDEVAQSLAEDGAPAIPLAFGVGSAPDDGRDFAALLEVAEAELAHARSAAEPQVGGILRAA